jgi:hypothetical protein
MRVDLRSSSTKGVPPPFAPCAVATAQGESGRGRCDGEGGRGLGGEQLPDARGAATRVEAGLVEGWTDWRWRPARLPELRRSICIGLRYGSFLTGRFAAALRAGLWCTASGLVARAPTRSLAASNERNSASCLICFGPDILSYFGVRRTIDFAARSSHARRSALLRSGQPLAGRPHGNACLHCQLSTENCLLRSSARSPCPPLGTPPRAAGRLRRPHLRASCPTLGCHPGTAAVISTIIRDRRVCDLFI